MSTIEDRSLDKLADMIYNVLWQDLLEVWRVIRKKMDAEGVDSVRAALKGARKRFMDGPFEDHIEVRWGMNLCVHCNDDNIEKNGIAYLQPSGDGLEFNQCLNCRIGILYDLVTAKATMDSYNIALGKPGQFGDYSFFWNAIFPEEMIPLAPTYEVIKSGEWIGTISFDDELNVRHLPFHKMKDGVPRGAEDPWQNEVSEDMKEAIDSFIESAREQIEVVLAVK